MEQFDQSLPPPAYTGPPPGVGQWDGRTNGFSIAGLITAILGCMLGFLGLLLGIAGIVQSNRNGDRRGRNLGIAAVVISSLWLVAVLAVVGVITFRELNAPDRDDTGALIGSPTIEVSYLQPGDCVRSLNAEGGSHVDTVPCAQPHTSEVVGVVRYPEGTVEPQLEAAGMASLDEFAESTCRGRYALYQGRPIAEGEPVHLHVARLAGSDDLHVICFYHRDTPVTGSMRG